MQGPESEELAAASRLEDDINFYQTVNPDVAKLFHVDPNAKRPALILLKKEEEKLNHFGQFDFSFLSLLSKQGPPSPIFIHFPCKHDIFSSLFCRWPIR
jgi:hypothetical protein